MAYPFIVRFGVTAALVLLGCNGSEAVSPTPGGTGGGGSAAGGSAGSSGVDGDGGAAGGPVGPIGFDWPEGGELRVEYVGYPGGEYTRGIAFFKSEQAPEATAFPQIGMTADGICNDVVAAPLWPTAPVKATYFDVGDLSITAAGKTFAFTKQTNFMDFLGRTHGVAYTFENAVDMVTPSTLYDVVLGGSSAASAGTWTGSLGIPAGFALVPKELPASIAIPAAQDFSFQWENPGQTIPQNVLGLIAFLDGDGLLAQLCLTRDIEGGFTVPKATVAKLPPKGTLVRGQTTHQLRHYPLGRRVDVIGTWCYATPYTIP